jgi:hypothetical protein
MSQKKPFHSERGMATTEEERGGGGTAEAAGAAAVVGGSTIGMQAVQCKATMVKKNKKRLQPTD